MLNKLLKCNVTKLNHYVYGYTINPQTPKQVKTVCMGLGLHYNNPFFNHTYNHNPGYQKLTGKSYGLQKINLNKSFTHTLKNELLYNLKHGKYTPLTGTYKMGKITVFTGKWYYKNNPIIFKLCVGTNTVQLHINKYGYLLNYTNKLTNNNWLVS